MSTSKRKSPGRVSRGLSLFLGLILTLILFLTAETLLGGHVLLSGTVHGIVTGDAGVLESQMKGIRERIGLLAEEKGFSGEAVMKEITTDGLKELNSACGEWLRNILLTGKAGETPAYPTEGIRKALESDQAYMDSLDPFMADQEIANLTAGISRAVTEKSLQFREVLLRAAVKTAGKEMSLQALSEVIRKVPAALGLLVLILSGLIVLLLGRRAVLSLKYIGAAMAACGLLLLLGLILIPLLGIGPMLKSVSDMLAREYHLLTVVLVVETVVSALVLICLGIMGMKKAGGVEKA